MAREQDHRSIKRKHYEKLRSHHLTAGKEVISDEGRFRILFPGDPRISSEVATVTEFKFTGPEANWSVSYTDLTTSNTDEVWLRDIYRQGVEAVGNNDLRVIRQNDIYVNGKLGTQFVLEGRGTMSFMRGLLVGRRLWTLAVDGTKVTKGNSTTPKYVRQFLDSFTFWE